ncbi:hypothetical protein ACN28S_23645 [Cystobacter fuscus]
MAPRCGSRSRKSASVSSDRAGAVPTSASGRVSCIATALNHSAFNLANALGAWFGGLVISAGFGWNATGVVGAAMAIGGLTFFAVSMGLERRSAAVAQRNAFTM